MTNENIIKNVQTQQKEIIGYESIKQELKDLGEMLSNVDKYRKLGVRIPRGLVLYGNPGVGKSVMARSIACGDTNTVELRAAECCSNGAEEAVKEVFAYAKEHAPCVLILDELDKIAGMSIRYYMQTNSDVNKTLLQEIDAISDDDCVLVVATANDTHCLGSALLRFGRFDRQIKVNLPDEETRQKILRHYFSKVKLSCLVDIDYISKITHNRSGAELECIVNESAICALTRGNDYIELEDVQTVINKMIFDGLPEKLPQNERDLKVIATHEAGHTVVAMRLLPEGVHGATIIPQGDSAGHMTFVQNYSGVRPLQEIEYEIAIALAGRVAEKERFDTLYAGSENDLKKASKIARWLVTEAGLTSYRYIGYEPERFENDPTSQQATYEIELEVEKLLIKAEELAKEIITTNRAKFDEIVEGLMNKHTLNKEELLEIEFSDYIVD